MDIVRIYIYIYTRAISFPRAGDRLLLVRFHDRWFIFRLDGNRGRGINVAIDIFPEKSIETTIFRFFKTSRRFIFFFLSENGRLIARIISVILARIKIGGTEF